jgi:hypothetical protein
MTVVEAFHLQPHVTPETGPCQEKDASIRLTWSPDRERKSVTVALT